MNNNILLLSIVALLTVGAVNTASAQRDKKQRQKREKTELVQKNETQENTVSQSAKQNAIKDIESLYAANTAKFDSAKMIGNLTFDVIEHPFLRKGESTRVKILINPQFVTALEIKGYGKATPEDIKKGCYTITFKAEESTFLMYKFSYKLNGQENTYTSVRGNFIIVTEPENIIEYTIKQNEYIENNDYQSLIKFRKEIVGEEFIKNIYEQMTIYQSQP